MVVVRPQQTTTRQSQAKATDTWEACSVSRCGPPTMRLLGPDDLPRPAERPLSPRTKFALSLGGWVSVVSVIAGASFSLGIKAEALSRRFDTFNRKFAAVLTKRDLQDVKREVSKAFYLQVSSGQAWCNCPRFEVKGERRSHCTFSGFVLPEFPPLPDNDDDDNDDKPKPQTY